MRTGQAARILSLPLFISWLGAKPLFAQQWSASSQLSSMISTGNGPTCGTAMHTVVESRAAGFRARALPGSFNSLGRWDMAPPIVALDAGRRWNHVAIEAGGALGPANADCAALSEFSRTYVRLERSGTRGGAALSWSANGMSSLDPTRDRAGIVATLWRKLGGARLDIDVRSHVQGSRGYYEYSPREEVRWDSLPTDSGIVVRQQQLFFMDTIARRETVRAFDVRSKFGWRFGRVGFDVMAGGTAANRERLWPAAAGDTGRTAANAKRGVVPLGVRFWGRGDVHVALSSNIGFSAGIAALPANPVVGTPVRRVSSFAVTIRGLSRRSVPRVSTAQVFETVRRDSANVTFRVHLPNARSVDWTGDLTQWSVQSMRRVPDGWWEIDAVAPSGTYRVNIRVDGGRWQAPPGAAVTRDEFGGEAGTIEVR